MFGRRSQFGFLAVTLTVAFSVFGQVPHLLNDGPIAPDLNTILTRMGQAQAENRARIHAYSVVREYKLYEEKAETPKTQLKAKIEFLPPHSKRYDVLDSTGGIGEKVVRRILDHEIAMTRDPAAVEMSPANYDFR